MSQDNTSIQQSALTSPLDQLSLPTVNIIGQVGVSTNNTVPATYKTDTDPSSGPFFANTANNIQLFTDIYNSNVNVENVIDGVPHAGSLDKFLHSVLGTSYTENTTAVCVKYIKSPCRIGNDENGVPYTTPWTRNFGDMIIPVGAQLEAINKSINGAFVSTRGAARVFGSNHENLYNDKWFLLQDILDAVSSYMLDRTLAPIALVENTTCKDNAGGDDFYTYATSRNIYKLALKLENELQGVAGVTPTSPPENLSIQFPVADPTIRAIFVNPADAATFSSRVLDVKINPDSIQTGPSDPTKVMKVFNTRKFNFSDDIVPLDTKSPTVLQSLNLVDRKTDKNFDLANAVESNVWSTGVGDWRNSQSDDPNITAQLSAAGYTESGSQALRRLNLIPVTSGDKIQVLSADSTGSPVLVVDTSSQVNLLEAIWTSWKNIMELNTDIYGVTATNMPELSSIALNEALSGQSVIEILNNFHTTLQQIGSGGSGLTLSGLSDFVELSGRVHTNSTNISTLSTNMMLMSACCGTNAYNLSALSAEVTRLSKTDTLSSLITMLSTIDTLTLIQRLSGLTQDFTTILQLSTDVYNLSGSIGIQNEEIERLKLVLQPLYDVDLYDLEFCCETNRQSISALELRMDTLSLSALSGLNDIFNAVNLSTYITRLSSIEQTVAEFEDVRNIINNVTTNTINISSNVTTLSALSSNVYSQIQELRDLIPGSTDAGELSALTNIINSITDISVFLQQLSTDERMIDLELCCEENRVNIGNFTTTLSVLSSAVNNNIITINSLSGLMSQPAGVVLTTRNQTVSGHKTFKNTLVVESSGHFHNNMTLGDMSQPKIFNICSDNGTTLININGLPSQLNINELSPGDMYTVDINGHKVLAIK